MARQHRFGPRKFFAKTLMINALKKAAQSFNKEPVSQPAAPTPAPAPEAAPPPPATNENDDTALRKLTPREMDVLELVAEGMQNKHIAGHLQLSEHTVKLHLHHVISKLGARNRTEAAIRFRRNGVV